MNTLKVLESQITGELEKLKRLLNEAAEVGKKRPSNINIRAGASILHDFYTGVEDIFHAIASTIDSRVPSGVRWHIELLHQMTLDIDGVRSHIISKEAAKMLEEYLRFRHLFRKRYGFDLEWINIKHLLKRLPAVYSAFEKDISKVFMDEEK